MTLPSTILNDKFSLSGNLTGTYKKNTFSSLAQGKIILGSNTLLDAGQLNILVENGKLSRSVYQCHNALIEKYPKYSKELGNILDLFLNVESYSSKQIIDALDEMQVVIECLYYKKSSPYIVKVYYADKY